jgi:hypothetical protein
VSTKTNVGFARLFFGDAAIVFLLLNDARHRTVARVFGTSRGDSNVVTVLALGSAAVAVHGAAARLRTIPRHPSGADSALGAAVLREATLGIAGAPARAVPAAGALLGLALVGRSSRPLVRRVVRTTRGSVRSAVTAPLRLRAFARGRYAETVS